MKAEVATAKATFDWLYAAATCDKAVFAAEEAALASS